MLYHITRKRNGKVITQSFLWRQIGFLSAVLDAEKQFVAFLAILAHQRADILHRRGFYLLKTKQGENAFNGIEDIIAASHFELSEVSRSFWYTWFLCHNSLIP